MLPQHGRRAHLAQWQGISSNLCHQQLLLDWGSKVNAALQHTAAVAVRGNLHGVGAGSIIHELAVLRAQPLEAPLNDVVAIEVPDERHHALLERGDHQLPLQSDKRLLKLRFQLASVYA